MGIPIWDMETEMKSLQLIQVQKYFTSAMSLISQTRAVSDNLDLNLTYDDGAVIYLNGNDVWRVNMPVGPISYSTFAAGDSGDNAVAANNLTSTLVTGTNVLAVEIHQRTASSSDISFDFRLIGNPLGVVNVTRGPYLQKGSASSMTLKWRTSTATSSVVHFGTTQGALNLTESDLTNKTEHEIQINSLSSGTIYYYDIANATTVLIPGSSDQYFKTHPNIGVDQPLTAWILGDCGTANTNQRNVRDAYYNYIGANHTDMVLFLGDNAYNDGTDSEYQTAVFENMYEDKLKNSVSWSCLGNHDGHSANSSNQTGPYYDIFSFPTNGFTDGISSGTDSGTEAYYSFDYGNVHFISLDSYETNRAVGGAMYNWCLADIQNTTADWVVVFWHHPPYTKGSHNSDTETELIDMRTNFLPMLETNGVDLVLSGHSHSYERSYFLKDHHGLSGTFNSVIHTVGTNGDGDGRIGSDGSYQKMVTGPEAGDGAVYITAGSSGKATGGTLNHPAMFHSVNLLGSCVLEVDGDEMNVKFITDTGAINDFFTISKPLGCIVGTPCDDGDPNTGNDLYQPDCSCAGDLIDCLGVPGGPALPGTTCDDGDALTGNDIYQPDCSCAGQFIDCLGVPGGSALIGTTCDDGDPLTGNDLYQPDCSCAGQFIDCLGVPGGSALVGTSCDDGDPLTGNDTYQGDCSCSGIPIDCLGVPGGPALPGTTCDDDDPNTGNDIYQPNCSCAGDLIDCLGVPGGPALPGTTCDDGDPNTTNDIYQGDCSCTGTPVGTCTDVTLDFNDFEAGFGTWNDGGNDCARNASNANSGSYSIRLRDNSGSASSMFTDNIDLSGTDNLTVEFSFITNSMENGEDFFLELSTDGGSNYSTIQEWNSGTEFQNNQRENVSVEITGVTFTTQSRVRIRCDASGNNDQVYIDDARLVTCDVISCNVGGTCDDGDPNTVNDVYDANCNCAGQIIDCLGVPDGTALPGTTCDDGNNCTIGDVYNISCTCVGVYTDQDGDGLCIGDDPDDLDGCNPDPNSPACNSCATLITDGFESNFGNWNDGGNDCARSATNSNTGSYSIRLRDNSGASSSMFTDVLDLSAFTEVNVDFSFIANSMETGEDFFLEVSTNGGTNYTAVQEWNSGTEFSNNQRVNVSLAIPFAYSSNTRFRIRCDASGNNDQVYIDDVVIEGCVAARTNNLINVQIVPNTPSSQFDSRYADDVQVYPNPTSGKFVIKLNSTNDAIQDIQVFDIGGGLITTDPIPSTNGKQELDLTHARNGLYIIRVITQQGEVILSRLIKQ